MQQPPEPPRSVASRVLRHLAGNVVPSLLISFSFLYKAIVEARLHVVCIVIVVVSPSSYVCGRRFRRLETIEVYDIGLTGNAFPVVFVLHVDASDQDVVRDI